MNATEEKALSALIMDSDKKTLRDLLVSKCQEDADFYRKILKELGGPADQEFTALRKACDKALSQALDDIDRYGPWNVPILDYDVLYDIANRAVARAREGKLDLAREMVLYAAQKCIDQFESECEYGGECFEISAAAEEVAEAVIAVIAELPEDVDARAQWIQPLIDLALSDYAEEVGMRGSMLYGAVSIATKNDREKLERAIEKLEANHFSADEGKQIHRALIRRLDGQEADMAYLRDNLDVDTFRKELIDRAREEGRFDEAIQLCKERLKNSTSPSRSWEHLLYDIYGQAGRVEEQTEQARRIVAGGDVEFFDIAREHLVRAGRWEEEYPKLLKALKQSLRYPAYMDLLAKENETERLMQQVRIHPDTVLTYGEILFPAYAEEIAQIGQKLLRNRSNHVSNRAEYRNLAEQLKRFAKTGARKKALELLDQIRADYPRKRALQEELAAARQSIADL